jgi:16S rRNA (cytosine967-C5)-methyltransferase
MLDPQPGESLLDTCAAPGGKSVFAAQLMMRKGSRKDGNKDAKCGTSRVLAMDVSSARLKLVQKAVQSAGVGNVISVAAFDLRLVTDRG